MERNKGITKLLMILNKVGDSVIIKSSNNIIILKTWKRLCEKSKQTGDIKTKALIVTDPGAVCSYRGYLCTLVRSEQN